VRGFTYDAAGNVIAEARTGGGGTYGYTYNAAGRMETFSINGFLQAQYKYDAMGRQAIRTLTSPTPVTIHSVFDSEGRRIAEYNETSGTLIREYVWHGWEPVAVIEGGVVYFIRADHIGRPVFATNAAGVKVWTATYHPFGGVHTSTGDLPTARFPGQWFQSESGLHQNWMRDYDPTTGRYLQADPLGLVDGASVYGYVTQNPGRLVDPHGLQIVGPQSLTLPDYNPYSDDLKQCNGDDCYDQWLNDQGKCYDKHTAHAIADLPACLSRARDIYNHCTSGGGGPPPLPWSAYDEDVEKPKPKKPARYGQPPAKPGITSSVGSFLTGLLVLGLSFVMG